MASRSPTSAKPRLADRHPAAFRRLGLGLLVLFLLLLAGELACGFFLRHRSNRYLVADVVRGRAVWRENPYFMYRFFRKRAAEIPPPLVARQERAPGTFRVCILGDSAAAGWPDAAYSVARHLEMMLGSDPAKPVEVLNMALHEGNSHVMREVVRDLDRLRPDLAVILLGNNEVAGPCGPAAGFGRFHNSSRLARIEVVLSRSRLVQAFRLLHDRLHPAQADEEAWKGREPLAIGGRMAPNDPKLFRTHRAFEKNMAAIVRQAKGASGRVLLCTVPVNLRDEPPFATVRSGDEVTAQQVRETLRTAAAATNEPAEALAILEDALRLNPLHADALWSAAVLQESLGNAEEAIRLFLAARDKDALRLRIDSSMNQTLRNLAESEGVPLLDLEALFFAESAPRAPGRELFFDHVHFTFHATWLAARAILENLAASPLPGAPLPGTVPSESEVSGLLLYEIWGHLSTIRQVQAELQMPHFRRLANHAEMMAHWAGMRASVEARLAAIPLAAITRVYAKRHADAPNDAWIAARAAAHFIERKQSERAANAARDAMVVWPFRTDIRGLLSLALALEGEPAAAGIARITGGQDNLVYADISTALVVGAALRDQKRYEPAEEWLAYAKSRDPYNSEAWILYAEVLRLQQRYEEADAALETASRLMPGNPLILEERAVLHCYWDRWKTATAFFTQAEELAPDRSALFYKWADVLFHLRDYKRAATVIKRFRTLEPTDPDGIELERWILAKLPPDPKHDDGKEKKNVKMIWE
jgi:tetratricopeptide (TPR) repeat protein